jgi:hypothetical protein
VIEHIVAIRQELDELLVRECTAIPESQKSLPKERQHPEPSPVLLDKLARARVSLANLAEDMREVYKLTGRKIG